MQKWWSILDIGIQSAIIDSAATVLVSLVGIGTVVWQIRSQFSQNRESIKETEKRRFKTEFFEKSIVVSEEFVEASVNFQSYLLTTKQSVEIATAMAKLEQPFPIPSQRVPELMRLHAAYSETALNMVRLIESRLVLDPRLAVFKNAILSLTYNVTEKFQKSYLSTAMRSLPIDRPQAGIFEYKPPTDNKTLITLTQDLIENLFDSTSYSADFDVEMQNLLLSDLFGRTTPHRIPLDKSHRVIRLENFEELNAYFLTDTDWGRMCNEVDKNVKERLENKA